MTPPSKPPQSQIRNDSQRWYPFGVLALIFGLLTARWIWIAGISDHGWIYEVGMRVWLGEVPYRDYICALPQLTTYTIVPLLALLDGSVWAVQVHLYLWWLGSLVVGLQIMRRLSVSPQVQAAGIFLAACTSFPAICLGHTYSYAGTALFGLLLLRLLRHQETAKPRELFIAGLFAGLTMLAKQNIGAVGVLLGLIAVTVSALKQKSFPALISETVTFSGGALSIFLPVFAYFAAQAGAHEVLSQMFLDAGAGKGGPLGMAFHTVPILFFDEDTPHRALWMVLVSGAVTGGFLWLFGWRNRAGSISTKAELNDRDRLTLPLCSGVVALLLLVSVFDLPAVKNGLNQLRLDCFHPNQAYVGVWTYVLYCGGITLSAICLWYCLRNRRTDLLLPVVALPLLACGHDLSTRGYLPYAAPVVFPLAVFLLERCQLVKRPARLAYLTGTLTVLVQICFPQPTYNAASFEPLYRLPDQSKFAHLWSTQRGARIMEIFTKQINPRISGERTLWFTIGGPHLAHGGKPVRSVALLHSDSYNGRSEPPLFAGWEADPPKFVFVGYYVPCANSVGFQLPALQAWLAQRYHCTYQNDELNMALWELKTPTTTQSR